MQIAPHSVLLDPELLAIGLLTALATLAGGGLALGPKSRLGLLVGFGAGAVLGVALFDLLPEALELGGAIYAPFDILTALACGFAAYLVVDRTVSAVAHWDRARGHLAAGALTFHSLIDGVGIGMAFHISNAIGLIVAVAVLGHDLIDGANTVTLALSGGASRRSARAWLAADAAAPLVGIWLSRPVAIPQSQLALAMALFAGVFLYIGASELLPRSAAHPARASTLAATLAGLVMIFVVVRMSRG